MTHQYKGGLMDKSKEFMARRLFESNRDKFPTKRSASKYLNHFGRIWKAEKGIPLDAPKRQ